MPRYNFSCEHCGWADEMLVHSYDDVPLCPTCGRQTQRLFSPTTALFVSDAFKDENIEPVRAVRDRTERDPQFAAKRQRAQQVADLLNERVTEP